MEKIIALMCISLFFMGAKIETDLDFMQKKYLSTQTLSAKFEQFEKSMTLGTTKVSKGTILIQRPTKFRWETTQPETSTLVSDGKKVWYYLPPFRKGEKAQLTIRQTANVQSKLAMDILSGNINLKKDFKVNRLGLRHYSLVPIKPSGDLKYIELFLENKTYLVYKLRLVTKTGNETQLLLNEIQLNIAFSKETFNFQAPQGVAIDIEEVD